MASPLSIRKLQSQDSQFPQQLSDFIRDSSQTDSAVSSAVTNIINDIRQHGDSALLTCIKAFDKIAVDQVSALKIDADKISELASAVSDEHSRALDIAMQRIARFCERQKTPSWEYNDAGVELGQRVQALDSVGVYIPGGTASYPSSVLMNVVPARIAGVQRIVATTPTRDGSLNPLVAKALQMTGVEEIYTIGGAHAIAALAYGTETMTPVDKIVGPGNAYVAEAKRQVYGKVGIDMPAGPSEILIICDGKTDPLWITYDLFAQSEHDEQARAVLICTDASYFDRVESAMAEVIEKMPRKDTIRKALNQQGLFVHTDSLDNAIAIANAIAPEHLQLSVENPDPLLEQVRNAGAVFINPYTSEVLGDYCAGTNHILPTAGAARYASALGVYDFQKRINTIRCSADSASELGEIAACLAEAEGLFAHAESAKCRRKTNDS